MSPIYRVVDLLGLCTYISNELANFYLFLIEVKVNPALIELIILAGIAVFGLCDLEAFLEPEKDLKPRSNENDAPKRDYDRWW